MNVRSEVEAAAQEPTPADASNVALPRKGPDAAALSEFFGSLAHDLRSPLGVVSETLTELKSELATGLTDEHRLLVGLADRGVRRLGRIADTISLLSVLESGTFEVKPRPVDLFDLLREACAAASAVEPRREVTLSCELPEGPCPAVVDAERLSRGLVELVINAVRHARRQARMTVKLTPDEAQVILEDDGQGVAATSRANLFRRFAPRASRSGLGVGLSIAHDVVVAHGGRITLEDSTLTPGRAGTIGARFVVTLPLAARREPAPTEPT